MSFVAVLPSIYQRWSDECLNTVGFYDRVHVIDNTTTNRGVAASWNLGRAAVIARKLDHLVIMSAGIRFGDARGQDFIDQLVPGEILEAAVIGWHLIAFPREVLIEVGEFDEIFWPAYFEDNDYGRRLILTYGSSIDWKKPEIDVKLVRPAHGIALGKVQVPWRELRGKYEAKWNGLPTFETFTTPYNDPSLPLTFVGPR